MKKKGMVFRGVVLLDRKVPDPAKSGEEKNLQLKKPKDVGARGGGVLVKRVGWCVPPNPTPPQVKNTSPASHKN